MKNIIKFFLSHMKDVVEFLLEVLDEQTIIKMFVKFLEKQVNNTKNKFDNSALTTIINILREKGIYKDAEQL